jgi:YD repeat-containing protein
VGCKADGAYKLAYSYDGNGNRTKTHTEYDTTAADGTTQHVTYDTYNTYDRMNRQLIVNGTLSGSTVVLGVVRDLKTSQDLGVIGHQLTYDLAGNRLSDTYRGAKLTYANGVWNATTAATDTTTETYGYDGAGRLATVTRDGIRIDTRYYDAAGRVLVSGMAAQDVTSDQSLLTIGDRGAFDAAIKTAGITSQFQIFAYDPAGHVMRQVTRNIDRGLQGDVYLVSDEWNPTAGYDADGNLTGYTAIDMSHGQKIKYTISYNFRDGAAQETNTTVVSDGGQKSTTSDYDVNGNRYIIHNGNTGVDTHLFYDTSGHVLQKVDGTVETFSLIVNDQVLGVEDKQANNVMGMTYTSLSSQAPTDAPSIYTVQADTETLQTIAKSLWGDGSLWYVIADANGMTAPGPLQVGQTLRVPTRVTTVHNTSDTFKPYSASDAIGDVTPLPVPSNSHGGCGTIGTIIAVVIAAVVTVYTAGAAAGWLAGAAPSVFGATAAGAAAAGAAAVPNALALAVGGAIGGAAGSAASQSFSIAAGLQSGFDWHGVARSAIGGAVSGAVNGAKLFDGMDETWQTAAARAAVSSTISQGINIATGLQHGFDWRAVATSSAGAGVGAQVDGTKLPFGGFGNAVASRFAGGMTTSLLSGGKVDVAMVAADAFGNVLGNSLAQQQRFAGMDARVDEVMGDVLANGERLAALNAPAREMPLDDENARALGADAEGRVVVVGKRPPSWLEENILQPVEHGLSETVHFLKDVGQTIGDGLSDLLAKPSGSTDEIPAQWNNWGRPSITGPIDYSHGSLRDLPIQTGPMLVPTDPATEARAHAQALRNGNNVAMALGGPFVATPMLAARQFGGDETQVSQAGMLGLSALEAYSAGVGGPRPPTAPPAARPMVTLSTGGGATLPSLPNPYEGVRQASAYLKSMGVDRAQRVQILQSFDVSTMSVETAGDNLFGLRFHDFGATAKPLGSYLFETFTPQTNPPVSE